MLEAYSNMSRSSPKRSILTVGGSLDLSVRCKSGKWGGGNRFWFISSRLVNIVNATIRSARVPGPNYRSREDNEGHFPSCLIRSKFLVHAFIGRDSLSINAIGIWHPHPCIKSNQGSRDSNRQYSLPLLSALRLQIRRND